MISHLFENSQKIKISIYSNFSVQTVFIVHSWKCVLNFTFVEWDASGRMGKQNEQKRVYISEWVSLEENFIFLIFEFFYLWFALVSTSFSIYSRFRRLFNKKTLFNWTRLFFKLCIPLWTNARLTPKKWSVLSLSFSLTHSTKLHR